MFKDKEKSEPPKRKRIKRKVFVESDSEDYVPLNEYARKPENLEDGFHCS